MRGFWFVAGTAAGVYVTAKTRRAAEAVTVDGIHDRLTGWFAGARVLGEELRAGAFEKETELRSRLALVPDEGTPDEGAANVLQLDGHRRTHIDTHTDTHTHTDTEKGDD